MVIARQQICYVDTGGTFSDAFIDDEQGNFTIAKAPTTPHDISQGFYDALQKGAKSLGLTLEEMLGQLDVLGFGATIVINALITRTGRKVGLVTTAGNEDVLELARAKCSWIHLDMTEIMRMQSHIKGKPLVPRYLVKGVRERVDCKGNVVVAVYEQEARQVAKELLEEGVESIVVLTLWDFLNDVNERRIAEIVREVVGDKVEVLEAAKISPMLREFQRTCSAIIQAYTAPLLEKSIRKMNRELREKGYKADLLIMQSMGGVASAEHCMAVNTIQSGPVGGLIGGRYIGQHYGYKNLVTVDMGGTSLDVGLIVGGRFRINREPVVEQMIVSVPVAEIVSIGAGGGTIAGVDALSRRLYVGPKSAGAVPGPAAYGAGGEVPTVTDADLVLGYLNPDYFLGGDLRLDRGKAAATIEKHVADPLGMSTIDAAAGIRTLIDTQMREAMAGCVTNKGFDPREFVLVIFGGAGPTHAGGLTQGFAFKEALVFPYSAVFSAFGAASADIEHTVTKSVGLVIPPRVDDAGKMELGASLNRGWEFLEDMVAAQMQKEGFQRKDIKMVQTASIRYRKQLHDLIVTSPVQRIAGPTDFDRLIAAFETDYEGIFTRGATYRQAGYEIYEVGVTASVSKVKPRLVKHELVGTDARAAIKGKRMAYFDGAMREVVVYDLLSLRSGNVVPGPAIVEAPTTTMVVPADADVSVDEYLTLRLVRR